MIVPSRYMIDKETVEKILDTADIVDVVSDFVSLKKRGANWVGLCPFHNDRRPSFYVSRAKNFCKCFSCGEGGSPVNFIMKQEQLSYPEALRYLAKKYNIEIEERELTDDERKRADKRESMFVINEFAMQFFEHQLYETQEGVDIGLSYFRERGFSDESLKIFHLGYSPDQPTALRDAVVKAGYNEDILLEVGLCWKDERGNWHDKFRGRVIFPIFTKSGKVVAFGGRTLHNHPAKYLNSPESLIYHKRETIYGLAQAKKDISKLDKCFIVEGYADVISMHQAGFKNVIATSGTALTHEHIHTIRNLTSNVTELFDGDDAGIKAALKGVDLLLEQDLNIKVLVLPSPEDPDSFARSHSATEITAYINQNEQDFIDFKTDILLKDCENDPIKKSKVIESVLRSVAHIPNVITRSVYAKECVRKFQIPETTVLTQIDRYGAQIKAEEYKRVKLEERMSAENCRNASQQRASSAETPRQTVSKPQMSPLTQSEYEVVKYLMKYGCSFFLEQEQVSVLEWLSKEIQDDALSFSNPLFDKIYRTCIQLYNDFPSALNAYMVSVEEKKQVVFSQEMEKMRASFEGSVSELEQKEEELNQNINAQFYDEISEFRQDYFIRRLVSDADDDIRKIANELYLPKHTVSKVHSDMFPKIIGAERLMVLVSAALFNWKREIITLEIYQLDEALKTATDDQQIEILNQINQLNLFRKELAKLTGERVVNPKSGR